LVLLVVVNCGTLVVTTVDAATVVTEGCCGFGAECSTLVAMPVVKAVAFVTVGCCGFGQLRHLLLLLVLAFA
jgi:hypothetical protein